MLLMRGEKSDGNRERERKEQTRVIETDEELHSCHVTMVCCYVQRGLSMSIFHIFCSIKDKIFLKARRRERN